MATFESAIRVIEYEFRERVLETMDFSRYLKHSEIESSTNS